MSAQGIESCHRPGSCGRGGCLCLGHGSDTANRQIRDDAKGGLSSVSAGPVSVSFNQVDRINLVPESVWSILKPIQSGAAGGWEVPLIRV